MLPELDRQRILRWADLRNKALPERARDQIRYEIDLTAVSATIVECRPPWRPDFGPDWTRFPVARLRYTKPKNEWSLYWRDRNLRFHLYDLVAPSVHVEDLLVEIDRDATGIFWG
ncbi:MAG: hypothetical protein QOK39_1080 [Acidimicrobiaceae bacterium]|nr:hypothetical protein [Acidimicrobiaceae bacterium]